MWTKKLVARFLLLTGVELFLISRVFSTGRTCGVTSARRVTGSVRGHSPASALKFTDTGSVTVSSSLWCWAVDWSFRRARVAMTIKLVRSAPDILPPSCLSTEIKRSVSTAVRQTSSNHAVFYPSISWGRGVPGTCLHSSVSGEFSFFGGKGGDGRGSK